MSQNMEALHKANQVRVARAEIKKLVREKKLTVADLLRNPPTCIETMPIGELLRSQHWVGATRVRKFLQPFNIAESRCIGDLTVRQRKAIGRELEA